MKSHKIIVIGVFYACLLVLFVLILFVVVFIKSLPTRGRECK